MVSEHAPQMPSRQSWSKATGSSPLMMMSAVNGEPAATKIPVFSHTSSIASSALSLAFHYLILALEAIRSAERNVDQARVLTRSLGALESLPEKE